MHGSKGTYRFPDGSVYEGEWFQDLQHGTGTMINADNTTEESGIWDNGKRQKLP